MSMIDDHASSTVIKSAAFCDLGLMTHWNGLGWLHSSRKNDRIKKQLSRKLYLIVPVVCSCTGSTTTPSFENFVISKTASDIAHEIKTEASANTRPGAVFSFL
jgi:hypothetical protein